MRFRFGALALAGAALLAGVPAAAECPPGDSVMDELGGLELGIASRTVLFEMKPPLTLYSQAASKPGKPAVEAEGHLGQGVIIVDLSVEPLWKAINDEDRYAGGDYVPLAQSEVIGGTARGSRRQVFQSYKRLGFGRWWVNEVWMNRRLFAESAGRFWELVWEDEMEEVDPDAPPLNELIPRVPPIRDSRGAWLLIPLSDDCTAMEYFTSSDPGGLVSTAQALMGGRTIRSTMQGMVRLARDYAEEPPDDEFSRPDGTTID